MPSLTSILVASLLALSAIAAPVSLADRAAAALAPRSSIGPRPPTWVAPTIEERDALAASPGQHPPTPRAVEIENRDTRPLAPRARAGPRGGCGVTGICICGVTTSC